MKRSGHIGRYGWNGDKVTSLSDRTEDRELTEAWEHYLAQTLAHQQAEQQPTPPAQAIDDHEE